jgi:hypothetical protein
MKQKTMQRNLRGMSDGRRKKVLCLEKGMWKTLKENGEIKNKSNLE